MLVVTDSNTYYTIRPEDIRSYISSPDPENRVNFRNRPPSDSLEYLYEKYPNSAIVFALHLHNITGSRLINMYSWVEKQILNTKSGMEHKLNTIFGDNSVKKQYGLEPGTMRIFSSTLICYYDGKNWNKVKV